MPEQRTRLKNYGAEPNRPTIAGVAATLYVHKFVDGRLYQITVTIEQDDFPKLAAALKEKFGEPTLKRTETHQNRFGAKFEGDLVSWENAVSELFIQERAGSIDRSILIMKDKQLTKVEEAKIKAANKPKIDDL